MKFLLLVIVALLFISCSTQRRCYPSKKSKDWAIRQWVKQRPDGYYVVHTENIMRKRKSVNVFECKPDSVQLDSLKQVL